MSAFSSLKKLFTKRESPKMDYHYRVSVFGVKKVGKTSIIAQFRQKDVPEDQSRYAIDREVFRTHNANVTLDVVDVSGVFKRLPASIHKSDAFILVYSVNSQESFDAMKQLRHDIIEIKTDKDVPIVFVANKKDLPEDQKAVPSREAEYLIRRKWRHGYVEATSSSYVDACEVFKQAVRQLTTNVHLSPVLERRRKVDPKMRPRRSVLERLRRNFKRDDAQRVALEKE